MGDFGLYCVIECEASLGFSLHSSCSTGQCLFDSKRPWFSSFSWFCMILKALLSLCLSLSSVSKYKILWASWVTSTFWGAWSLGSNPGSAKQQGKPLSFYLFLIESWLCGAGWLCSPACLLSAGVAGEDHSAYFTRTREMLGVTAHICNPRTSAQM